MTGDVRSVLTDTLRAALGQLWTEPEDHADLPDWEALPGKLADALLSLSGVAVTQLPEPVMVQFKKLPFPMQMRVAADVMDAVNKRYRHEYPTAGNSENEPLSPSSMRYLADYWQQADASALLAASRVAEQHQDQT